MPKTYCTQHGIVDATHSCGRWLKGTQRGWRNLRAHVLERDRYLCHCGQPATEVHHLEHSTHEQIVDPSQLRAVCFTHNPRGQ